MNATGGSSEAITFLNEHEAVTVDVLAGRIIPGSEEDPGAHEAGAVTYIDRALAGPYRNLQRLYRAGLAALDASCLERWGRKFVELDGGEQDSVLEGLAQGGLDSAVAAERSEAASEEMFDIGFLPYFFAVLRQHVVEGTFGDPVYGGNRNAVGWRLLGFPGARWGYGEEEMTYGFDSSTLPTVTLQDLRRERKQQRGEPDNG
ncbi:gluconate 2-dehydrogenase subunit 3 family protein [Arthrobacter sp. GCM10027362]|uniref:gluconate 2-dehydrogenase subunit 3 family protein n=1 Tax=Arthrobacter sp. GCM10027362 TaxID=3273379 RepID=UPI00363F74F7